MLKSIVIAIDGPAGSGKSTLAKKIAETLNFMYLDTGAMYRAITFEVLKQNVLGQTEAIINIVQNAELKLEFSNGQTEVLINGQDVTTEIRSIEVSAKVSDVSKIGKVREELVRMQREIAAGNNVVIEGRDITTVVFPEADVKVFLTASIDKRAERRQNDFKIMNSDLSLSEIKQNIEKRDKIDSEREVSPLTKAEGSLEIDTSELSVEEELKIILDKVEEIRNKIN
jgi:cytidylate kinase